jgi:hypothetical protein
MIFSQNKGRFALIDGIESFPNVTKNGIEEGKEKTKSDDEL